MGNKSDVWKMEIPQLPRWMFASEEWLDRDIELGTFSRALAGVREQGVSTVGQQAILTTAAGRKFVSPTKQLEHLATKSAEHILQWIDVLELGLRIRGHQIADDMLESDYSCTVSFELIDPVLQLQFRELGMREVQQGLKSKETYWSSDARLEDSTGEQKRLLEDLIREDPRVQELMAKEVAREAGLQDLLDKEEDRMANQQMAAMDAGATPGAGGMAAGPGMGRPPRNPLTPDTARPSRIGQERAR